MKRHSRMDVACSFFYPSDHVKPRPIFSRELFDSISSAGISHTWAGDSVYAKRPDQPWLSLTPTLRSLSCEGRASGIKTAELRAQLTGTAALSPRSRLKRCSTELQAVSAPIQRMKAKQSGILTQPSGGGSGYEGRIALIGKARRW